MLTYFLPWTRVQFSPSPPLRKKLPYGSFLLRGARRYSVVLAPRSLKDGAVDPAKLAPQSFSDVGLSEVG